MEEQITVTRAQDVPLLDRAAETSLTVTGAGPDLAFRYRKRYAYEPDGSVRQFSAADVPGWIEYGSSLSLAAYPDGDSLVIWIRASLPTAEQWHYHRTFVGSEMEAVSYDRLGVTVDEVSVPPFRNAPPGDAVVSGRFSFVTQSVDAGGTVGHVLREPSRDFLSQGVRLVFEVGGRLHLVRAGSRADWVGTWRMEGEAVRLRLPENDLDRVFAIDETDDGFRLLATEPRPLPDDALSTEGRFHVEAGTASNLRTAWVVDLAR